MLINPLTCLSRRRSVCFDIQVAFDTSCSINTAATDDFICIFRSNITVFLFSFVPGVSHHVNVKSECLYESYTTVRALMWPFISVCHFMFSEAQWDIKALLAMQTIIPFIPLVVQLM